MKLFKPAFEKDPRWQLSNWRALNQKKAAHYVSVKALHKMRDEVGAAALTQLIAVQPGPGGDNSSISHMAGEISHRIRAFGLGNDVMAVTALLSIAENDEYRQIAKEIEPLLKAAAERDAKEENERLEKQRAESALAIAREAAKARALESVETDHEVVAAKSRLAGFF